MNDIFLYIIIGLFILFVIYSVMKNQVMSRPTRENRDFRDYGDERPQYDHPDVTGSGGFGRDKPEEIRGAVESSQARETRDGIDIDWDDDQSPRPSPVNVGNDSPKVTGRGGFGRDKD